MKKTHASLLALSFILVFAGCQNQNNRVYPYPFDSAKIEMTLSGGFEGTQVVQIKGDKAVHETHAVSNMNGAEEKVDTLFIDAGDYLYYIDLNTKQGTKVENPITKQLKELPGDKRVDFLTRLAAGVNPDAGGELKAVSVREVAGQKCDVYNISTLGDICVWYGIPLASSASMPDSDVKNTTEATNVQLNVDVPDSAFDVPGDITLQ